MSPAARRAGLQAGLVELGLEVPAAAVTLLMEYLDQLMHWNAAYNLTAVRDPDQAIARHLLDSLAIRRFVSGSVIDIGSGPGLPAIPLAIVAPELAVTALDSNGTKARFLRHAVRTLGLPNVEVAEARAEAFQPGRTFDRVVSRAFSSLADFFGKTVHLLAPGGEWVAMKGKLDGPEVAAVPPGYQIRETIRLQVPGLAEERHVVIAIPSPESSRK
ncbi:MAG TPA: 16S rRNA (guanine(527)-N(7))-methyltransferase RsmG [Solimonas sp.]|nr:16S rRNA (guanine(527)-N(7))-methyltransferase RsmG [Solimonas sp.]